MNDLVASRWDLNDKLGVLPAISISSGHEDLRHKIEAMEQRYDQQFKVVFDAIKLLLETEEKPKPRIGFTVKERLKSYGRKRE